VIESLETTDSNYDYSVGRIGWAAALRHKRYRGGFGRCSRCDTPWNFVHEHSTDYDHGRGCFPLCEECWEDLATPEARLPFYRVLWEQWWADAVLHPCDEYPHAQYASREDHLNQLQETWRLIEAAVLDEGAAISDGGETQ
jgi:hypothetical protein